MAATRDISVRVRVVGDKEYRAAMKRISSATQTFAGWTDTAAGMLASDAIKKGFAAIISGIEKSINASINFESKLADVAKVTTMNATELEYFGKRMQELSTQIPVTAEELLGLAEIAGQLGVADEDIQEFTEVMAALGATTNLSSEQAAESIAKLANIMGTQADEFERVGSVIVELGNNAASSESEIVDMASRIAGVGALIGLSEADILGVSNALASLGIEADAGGGTISKWLTEMATDVISASGYLQDFAKVAGMSAGEFRKAWMDDPAQAFNAWIQGVAKLDENGKNALVTIGEFGVNEIRMRRVLASLVTGNETLTSSLEMSSRAWEENTALTEEAATRYGTSASQLSMFQNQLERLKVGVGNGLKPAVMQTVNNLEVMAEAAAELVAGTDSLPKMIADIDQAFATQNKGIDIAASQVYSLIDAMEDLGNTEDLDSAGLKQYYELLEKMRILAPDVAAIINANAGALGEGYDTLRDATKEWEKNERLSLEIAKAEEQISALEIAEKQLASTQAQLAMEQGKYNLLIAEEAMYREQMDKLIAAGDGTSNEYKQAEQAFYDTQEQAGIAENKINALTKTAAEGQTQIAEYGKEIQNTFAEISEASGVAVEAMSRAESAMLGNFELQKSRFETLVEEFYAAEEEARARIDEIISGYGKVTLPEAEDIPTAEEMIAGKESQIQYMKDYVDLLNKVKEMGVSGDMLAGLADGSTESYATMQAILEGGTESLTKLQELEAEAELEADKMATALAGAATDFDSKANEITGAMNAMVGEMNQQPTAYSNAAATIQGYIDGVNSKIGQLSAAINRVRNLVNAAKSYTGTWSGVGTPGYTPHAAGLAYVPYDDYPAMLHRGEMVLTALEAKAYRAEQYANYGMLAAMERAGNRTTNNTSDGRTYNTRTNNSYQFGDVYVQNEWDIKKLTQDISDRNKRRARGRGVR